KSGDVGGKSVAVVPSRRLVARAVATKIDRAGPEAGAGEGGELVAPRPPELREAVQQQHQWPRARLGNVKTASDGEDEAMRPLALEQHLGLVDRSRRMPHCASVRPPCRPD